MNLALIILKLADTNEYRGKQNDGKLVAAMNYIDMHFKENPSIGDCAKIVQLSPAYFSAWFKQQTGRSYVEHLTKLRVSYVCSLLRSGATVGESCFASGFCSLSRFNHVFKTVCKISPGEYRKRFAQQ